MPLIETYDVEIQVSTHSAEHFEYEATAHLRVDIGPVLPYLNATLTRSIYLPDVPALSWRQAGRNIGFWPHRIAVDNLESKEQAHTVLADLVAQVNRTWEMRGQIEPDHTTRRPLQPLEVYRHLPQTNCKQCGEETCYNFALKLAAGQVRLEQCVPLYAPGDAYREKRAALEAM